MTTFVKGFGNAFTLLMRILTTLSLLLANVFGAALPALARCSQRRSSRSETSLASRRRRSEQESSRGRRAGPAGHPQRRDRLGCPLGEAVNLAEWHWVRRHQATVPGMVAAQSWSWPQSAAARELERQPRGVRLDEVDQGAPGDLVKLGEKVRGALVVRGRAALLDGVGSDDGLRE
ncbi:hypothetical protein ACWEGE_19530 [Amycolatopsis sp. NPDC004747]